MVRSTSRGSSEILPHRYPFLLVDRVLEVQPGRRIVAIKNVSVNEPFFQGHWPGRPIMPGVLIIEAMAQAGGVLIAATVDRFGRVAMLASVDGVKLRRPVVPGDQLRSRGHAPNGSSRTRPPSPAVARVGDARGGRGQDPVHHGRCPRSPREEFPGPRRSAVRARMARDPTRRGC